MHDRHVDINNTYTLYIYNTLYTIHMPYVVICVIHMVLHMLYMQRLYRINVYLILTKSIINCMHAYVFENYDMHLNTSKRQY